MTPRQFDALAAELFGSVLRPLGFTNERSERCTFYRAAEAEVYHIIMPDIGTRGAWYDIKVFPHSPAIDPLFQAQFPDNLGIPTDSRCLLSEADGVNVTQQQFNCKTEENFRRGFTSKVAPLLVRVAVPYLDRFKTVADIIPAIRHPSFLGFALFHVGRLAEAAVALQKERDRLCRVDTNNQDVAALLANVERLLATFDKGGE